MLYKSASDDSTTSKTRGSSTRSTSASSYAIHRSRQFPVHFDPEYELLSLFDFDPVPLKRERNPRIASLKLIDSQVVAAVDGLEVWQCFVWSDDDDCGRCDSI